MGVVQSVQAARSIGAVGVGKSLRTDMRRGITSKMAVRAGSIMTSGIVRIAALARIATVVGITALIMLTLRESYGSSRKQSEHEGGRE
jgi:hypothetical protein